MSLNDGNKDITLRIFGVLVLVMLIINGMFTLSTISENIKYSEQIFADLEATKAISNDIYALNTPFAGWYFNLLDNGFNIVIDEDIFSRIGFRYIGASSTVVVPR